MRNTLDRLDIRVFHSVIKKLRLNLRYVQKDVLETKDSKSMETKYLINYFLIQEEISIDQLKMLPVVEL